MIIIPISESPFGKLPCKNIIDPKTVNITIPACVDSTAAKRDKLCLAFVVAKKNVSVAITPENKANIKACTKSTPDIIPLLAPPIMTNIIEIGILTSVTPKDL